ncbi:MAG: hypothetical protein WED07_12750 [Candidatus Freyarchaeum deiterrae]
MNDNELRELTEQYWFERWDVEEYIQRLLPKELDYRREHSKITLEPTEILVQLVGFSWEPLLISVCAYKPKEVILILNEWYGELGGAARGDKYKELVNKLKDKNLVEVKPEVAPSPWETVKDTPQAVFKYLRKHILPLLNEGKRVVIDITGAKKSMVSGAYLFAAYTNTPVCYVDDEFSERYGKPYGYTCKVSELKNPMELFKLREWDRVRQLYERFAFWSAKGLVEEIKESIRNFLKDEEGIENFLDDETLKSINSLWEWLNFYGLWADGDYRGSWNFKEMSKRISDEHCPTAVKKLGKIWPDKNDLKSGIDSIEGLRDIEKSIYLKDEEILVYADDELAKIRSLIQYGEDFRSALLRATGLNEFLLKARVVRLWVNNQFVIEMNESIFNRENMKNRDQDLLSKIDGKILEFSGAPYLIKSLRWISSKPDYCILINGQVTGEVKAHRSENALKLNKFWENIKFEGLNLPDDVFTLRNKAIHFCLSFSKEIADVAVIMAEKNLKEFKENWVKTASTNWKFEAMSWEELCDLCGIDFLPKRRVDRNE